MSQRALLVMNALLSEDYEYSFRLGLSSFESGFLRDKKKKRKKIIVHTAARTFSIISFIVFFLSSSVFDTLQQKCGIVKFNSFVRCLTRIDPSDTISRKTSGIATYRQDTLQVYLAMGEPVLLGPCKFTNTRTEEGFLAGNKADSMLKLLSDFVKL